MEFVKIVVVPFLVLIVVLVGIALAATSWQCNGYQDVTGKQTKMVGGNCYIKDGDRWFMWAEYKNRFVTNGIPA
jgi:hypothetical protein